MTDPILALAYGHGVNPRTHRRRQRWLRKMVSGRYGEIIVRRHRKRNGDGFLAMFQPEENDIVFTGWSHRPEDAVQNLCLVTVRADMGIRTNRR